MFPVHIMTPNEIGIERLSSILNASLEIASVKALHIEDIMATIKKEKCKLKKKPYQQEIRKAEITKVIVPTTDFCFKFRNLFFPKRLPIIAAITSEIKSTDKLIIAINLGKKNIVITAEIITQEAPFRNNLLLIISCFLSIKPKVFKYFVLR